MNSTIYLSSTDIPEERVERLIKLLTEIKNKDSKTYINKMIWEIDPLNEHIFVSLEIRI